MITACLISSTMDWQPKMDGVVEDDMELALYDSMDGPSEEEVYLAGMYSVFWSC